MRLYLKFRGFKDVFNLCYDVDKHDTIDKSTEDVNQELIKLGLDKDADELVLIGQSMGGVIANNMHTFGWNIKMGIYIGSPLHGAKILSQMDSILPEIVMKKIHIPPYNILRLKDKEKEPPHPYKTITMSWIFSDTFDGCVYKPEAILDEQHNTHLPYCDHRLVFANPQLWHTVFKLINNRVGSL
jgi:hypothetical protein